MGRVDVLLGLQWGDEGKGKIVDVLTPRYDMVARFQGGPNAGHTLEFAGEKYVLRSVPSGIFQGDKINIIGNGVVLDPVLFREEVESLFNSGHPLKDRLVISRKAHLILPTHRLLDAAGEKALGAQKVGTTGKGIGPTYTDKVSRHGVRVGDIEGDFEANYKRAKERHLGMLRGMGVEVPDLTQAEADFFAAVEYLRQFRFVDSEFVINNTLKSGKNILAEGAQGSMLDIDFGSYPFVTSSNTICAGSCVGLGVSPRAIGDVYGIFKAYCTRVGAGPFPTELFDEDGRQMAERPRRCGWIDLVALRYTIMLNGVTKLIMMKSDVLDTFATIKACRAYRINGVETRDFPYSIEQEIEPIYDEISGWQCDLTAFDREEQLPKAVLDYVAYLERELEVPIAILSVGPDRKQTIVRG